MMSSPSSSNKDKNASSSRQAATATTTEATVEPVCDICWQKGSKSNLSPLLFCRTCHVPVHAECYELGSTEDYHKDEKRRAEFECWACQAVGKTIKFRRKAGERATFTIQQRPNTCCLCGRTDTADYPHAMHPLYDDYGPRARQNRFKKQPAWVHTLCAVVVAKYTGGLVYACNRQGDYGGPQGRNDPERIKFDDASSINSELMQRKKASAEKDRRNLYRTLSK